MYYIKCGLKKYTLSNHHARVLTNINFYLSILLVTDDNEMRVTIFITGILLPIPLRMTYPPLPHSGTNSMAEPIPIPLHKCKQTHISDSA